MTGRNVLVLVIDDGFEAPLRRLIERRGGAIDRVRVVAPARVTPLQWLASDEDGARAEADRRSVESEWALDAYVKAEGTGGDADPVLAVEDVLHTFPADEILLVTRPDDDHGLEVSLLRQFGLPVQRVPLAPHLPEPKPARAFARSLSGGRSPATPLVAFAGVNLALLALGGVIALVIVIVVLLAT